MFPDPVTKVNSMLTQVPLPKIVEALGIAIANAQYDLDLNAATIATAMAESDSGITIGEKKYSLLELGFTPTFYQFTDAIVEAKVTFTITESREGSIKLGVGVFLEMFGAMVTASYTAKYSFQAEGSSSITAHLASVPPPANFADLLQKLIEEKQQAEE